MEIQVKPGSDKKIEEMLKFRRMMENYEVAEGMTRKILQIQWVKTQKTKIEKIEKSPTQFHHKS